MTYRKMLCLFIVTSGAWGVGCTPAGHGRLADQVLRGELSAAVKSYQEDSPDDDAAREDLAVAVLMHAARSEQADERREAFGQLSTLGPIAADWLLDLVQEPGSDSTKVMALGLLADMGDRAAVGTLRELAGQLEAELLPVAIPHLDAKAERSRLLAWLVAPDAELRRSTCLALRRATDDRQVALALAERLRLDPVASVRSAALQAVIAVGGVAQAAVADALSDDDQRIRFAALSALLAVGNEVAKERLQTLLHSDASEMAVEAARWVLLNHDQENAEAARGLLERALVAASPQLRAQTAVALRGLPDEVLASVSLARLEQEDDLDVRLQLALRHTPSDAATKVLIVLRDCQVPAVALEAAVILAQNGDHTALERVLVARSSEDARLRARAARALAGALQQPEAVVPLLADKQSAVRCAAAHALLALNTSRSA